MKNRGMVKKGKREAWYFRDGKAFKFDGYLGKSKH